MSQFKYTCTECGGLAKKDPVSKYDELKKTGGSLGTWHCLDKCKKGKVKVKRNKVGKDA